MARKFVPSQHQFLKYLLYFKGREYEIDPPDNWQTAQREIARSKQYHGMLVTLSDQVEFSGYTAQLCREFNEEDGPIANVTIVEYVLDENDEWDLIFSGTLDFSEFVDDELVFSVKVNSESLEKKMTSRYQTEITLDSKTNLDGLEHGEALMPRINVSMDERDILGEALLGIGTGYDSYRANNRPKVCVLYTNRSESYNGDLPRTYTVQQEVYGAAPHANNFIYYNQQDVTITVNFEIDFLATFELPASQGTGASVRLRMDTFLVTEEDDGSLTFSDHNTTDLATAVFTNGQTSNLVYNGTKSFLSPPAYGAILYIEHIGFGSFTPPDFTYRVVSSSCNISGAVRAQPTTNEAILPYDFFKRMIVMIGGKNLDSDLLASSRLSLANGYMIRNVTDEEGNRLPISYTFEKLFSSFGSVEPLGLSVSGNTVKIEKREYFYQDFIAKDFGSDITDVKVEFDKEHAFSEISIGFETSNFSREGALKEFNVRSVWVSPINFYKKELNMVSNIQGSHNTIETLRRVQYQQDVERTHSRQGDSTLYFLDLKDAENRPRTWSDDFEDVQNIPLKNSIFNLRLSPMNRLRNQGKWINFGYDKFPEKFLTFSSSTGATGMLTKPIGEDRRAENESIRIADMDPPKYIAQIMTFTIPPQNLFKELREKRNGVEKAYGIFRVTYNGWVWSGYLLNYQVEANLITMQIIRKESISEGQVLGAPVTPTRITLIEL